MFEYAGQAKPYKRNGKSIFTQRIVTEKDILLISDEELSIIYEKGLSIKKENTLIKKENRRLYEMFEKEFITGFEDMGMTVRGVRGGILKDYKSILRESYTMFYLSSHPAEIDDYSISFQFKGKSQSSYGNGNLERLKRFRKICEELQKIEDKLNKLLIKSVEYAKDNNINIKELSNEKLIKEVKDFAIKKYIEIDYLDGTEVDIDDNYCECAKWTVGDRRCSCGNVRLYLEVEGDILNGFTAYPTPH
jgi:hypothetical protein